MRQDRQDPQLLTVFTSTVYPDVARIWHACVGRAFPKGVRVEIFYDSAEDKLQPELFPGASVLSRTSSRREFHDAYNDAVARAGTPYLAIIDSDVFWVGETLWERVLTELQDPATAAVSCVSRHHRKSHGTFAVVMNVEIYQKVLRDFPFGFYPAASEIDPAVPIQQWKWHDTGDLLTEAVLQAGFKVRLHHWDETGELVRFHAITQSRRGAGYFGADTLARLAGKDRYFWRGYVCNRILKRLHDRVFIGGPRYDFPYPVGALAWNSLTSDRQELLWRFNYVRQALRGARQVERFVSTPIRG